MSAAPQDAAGGGTLAGYNFAYLDEDTKRMIRRALLKAVAIPGHQVPFGSREMPLPYGWGTGGIQVTASVIGPDDTLKVIDQGADDTTNAVSIRRFFGRVAGVATTERTAKRRSSRPATASLKRRCARARYSSTRCRCRSRCSGWSRAWRRRGVSTRSATTG
jgi:hypothetical protein